MPTPSTRVSQLKHLKQLIEYTTGLSARIGYPTSFLAKANKEEMKHPMFSTGLGLVLEGYKEYRDMKEDQKFEFYPEFFQVAIAEMAEVPEHMEVEHEPNMQLEEAEFTEPSPPKKNVLQSMQKYFRDWFEDERVNGDFQ
ncbi:MAG: hypothetical protein V4615_13045 [Bacteroidota bacterium]